ncbi:MAG TPA: alpha/beta fold hydrolase [Polyangiaceae bacterium]|nr:alpha/beta fold hydrolase [Polyangiaceae bacterium]
MNRSRPLFGFAAFAVACALPCVALVGCEDGSSADTEDPGEQGGNGGEAGAGLGGASGKGGTAGASGKAGSSQGGSAGKDAGVDSGDAAKDASSDESIAPEAQTEAGSPDPLTLLNHPCNDPIATFYDPIPSLPAWDSSKRGEIVRCAVERWVPASEIQAAMVQLGYKGAPLTSGARVVRFAYRTERLSNLNGVVVDGISAALALLPDHPRASSAAQPLVVAAHGSIGIADKCAPSRDDIVALGTHLDDAHSLMLPLVGKGWTVVAPDYAGFGFGATTAWSLAEDEAHSVLDSTRAMGKLLKQGSLSGKVVVVGHSQGGHATLATHAFHKSYGLDGTLVGVAAMAPLWMNNGAWGAALSPLVGLNTTDDKGTLAYSVDYFYGHGELYDGPGHGLDPFEDGVKDLVKEIFTTECLRDAEDRMVELGNKPGSFYSFGFQSGVSTCVISGVCMGDNADKWMPRFKADRPSIDPHGPPIVVWAGGLDSSITPGRIQCMLERFDANLAAATDPTTTIRVCADPTAVHSGFVGDRPDLSDGITRRSMDWVDQWIAARTLGEAEPPVCLDETGLSTEPLECETPPPNDE